MKRSIMVIVLMCSVAGLSFAKGQPEYQVGTFVGKSLVNDGSLVSMSGGYAKGVQQGHNAYTVSTDSGDYYIDAPTSVAGSMFMSMATNGQSANIHKDSFLDTLHEGDKVLFSAKCNKHNRCEIKMPNPDKPEKTIDTVGWFSPAQGKSNVSALCGRGKLSAALEAQYCAAPTPASAKPEQPTEAVQPAPAKVEQTSEVVQPALQPIRATENESAVPAKPAAPAKTPAPKPCSAFLVDKAGNQVCMDAQ